MGQKGILWCSLVPKRSKIGQEMAELWPRGCVIPLRTTWDKRGSFGVHLYQKDLKSVKKYVADLWPRGWVIPLRTTWDKEGSVFVCLYQNNQNRSING